MTKLLTLTHFGGLKIRVNPEHIAALIPEGVLRAVDSKGTDSQTKACIVLAGGSAYHVRETVAAVAALVEGTELKVVGNE